MIRRTVLYKYLDPRCKLSVLCKFISSPIEYVRRVEQKIEQSNDRPGLKIYEYQIVKMRFTILLTVVALFGTAIAGLLPWEFTHGEIPLLLPYPRERISG